MRSALAVSLLLAFGCTDDTHDEAASFELTPGEATTLTVDGLRVEIPAGAISSAVTVTIAPPKTERPLPEGGALVGPELVFNPEILLEKPATFTLDYVPKRVAESGVETRFVRVWSVAPEGWTLFEPEQPAANGTVTVELNHLTRIGAGVEH